MSDLVKSHNECLLKLIAEDYCNEQSDELEKRVSADAANPAFRITETDEAAFEYLRKQQKTKKIVWRTWQKVAVAVLALMFSATAVSFSVGAVRNAVSSFFADLSNGFVSMRGDSEYSGLYSPMSIPDGYKVESVDNTSDPKKITYFDGGKNYIYYKEYSSEANESLPDSGTPITVHGCNGILSDKTITWQEPDALCKITATSDDLDLQHFAETVTAQNE